MYEIFVKLLNERNLKAADVCRGTGLPSSLFSEWKKGKSNPKADKLQKIADFFGVTIEYLMTGKEPESRNERPQVNTIAAHFEGDEYTEEELEEIYQFAEFVKNKRK